MTQIRHEHNGRLGGNGKRPVGINTGKIRGKDYCGVSEGTMKDFEKLADAFRKAKSRNINKARLKKNMDDKEAPE